MPGKDPLAGAGSASDAWSEHGALATAEHADRLLEASRALLAQKHPEANVMHAVALVLQRRFAEALAFARSLDQEEEGSWPSLVITAAQAGMGRLDVDEVSGAWLRFLSAD